MCGIAGIISPHAPLVQHERLKAMADTLIHRGPEGDGYWINSNGNIGLAHRRLSIIDLSTRGIQPLHYLHYTIVFNGEIYNYIELKELLLKKGYSFQTETDTEIIPAAFDCWGINCLQHFDGMFAFALWDEKEQQLILARDRFGEKPLYYNATYHERGRFNQFIFGSEIKALWAAGAPRRLNGTMMLNYLTIGYVQQPLKKSETFYSDILSLPPGHYLTIQPQQGRVQMKRWYTLPEHNKELRVPSSEDACEQFKELFNTSVQRRSRSDVNIGTCLSGGVDSSSIVAVCNGLKAKHLTHDCFTAVFPGFEKDESAFSKKVADCFHLHQHTIEVTADDWINSFEQLMYHQEEPLQSSSVLTQFMVYRLAKEKSITVLLDGQGADEILGGYKRYTHWHLQSLLSKSFGSFIKEKRLLRQNQFIETWGWQNYAAAFFPGKAASQLHKRTIAQQRGSDHINKDFLLKYQNTDSLQKPTIKTLEDILYYNTFNFGLEELLRYADRNSMAHSREVRLPFLSHELVEFVFSLPSSFKIRDGFTKWILRQSMQPLLPAEIIWRKDKTGYEPPQAQWMQHPQIQEMIISSRKKLVNAGVLDASIINKPVKTLRAHEKGNADWRYLSAAFLL